MTESNSHADHLRLAARTAIECRIESSCERYKTILGALFREHPYVAKLGLHPGSPLLQLDDTGAILWYLSETLRGDDNGLGERLDSMPSSLPEDVDQKLVGSALDALDDFATREIEGGSYRIRFANALYFGLAERWHPRWSTIAKATVGLAVPMEKPFVESIFAGLEPQLAPDRGLVSLIQRNISTLFHLREIPLRSVLVEEFQRGKRFRELIKYWCSSEPGFLLSIVERDPESVWTQIALRTRFANTDVISHTLKALPSGSLGARSRDAVVWWLTHVRIEKTKPRRSPPGIPMFPNEDVYFHVNAIDNTLVDRIDTPAERDAIGWKIIFSAFIGVLLVIAALLPSTYTWLASIQIDALKRDRERLVREGMILESQESKAMTDIRKKAMELLSRRRRNKPPKNSP